MEADSARMEVAIALLERGFSDDRVEAALGSGCCGTLEEALQWLNGGTKVPSSDVQMTSNDAGAAPSTSKVPRRRMMKRSESPVALAATTGSSTHAPSPAAQRGEQDAPHGIEANGAAVNTQASSSEVVEVSRPASSSGSVGLIAAICKSVEKKAAAAEEPESPQVILDLHPVDASAWWRDAAVRWERIQHRWHHGADDSPRSRSPPPRSACEATSADDKSEMATPARPPATPTRNSSEAAVEDAQPSSVTTAEGNAIPSSASPARPSSATSPAPRNSRSSTSRLSFTPNTSPHAMRLNKNVEVCPLCCEDAPVGRAVRLSCSHGWYCSECMKRHSQELLNKGAANVTCPECRQVLAQRELRKLLPADIIDRLLTRSLEQAVSSISDLFSCPTPNCPMRVALDEGEISRLECPECEKESCVRCGVQPYHKGRTCEEHAEKLRARKIGKTQKEQLLNEERFNQWLQETGTKQCPTCKMGVTKQNLDKQTTQYSECHKMMCRNCSTKFCYKCLAVLTDTFSCGCTIDAHGFLNPLTGKRMNHLRAQVATKRKAGATGR